MSERPVIEGLRHVPTEAEIRAFFASARTGIAPDWASPWLIEFVDIAVDTIVEDAAASDTAMLKVAASCFFFGAQAAEQGWDTSPRPVHPGDAGERG